MEKELTPKEERILHDAQVMEELEKAVCVYCGNDPTIPIAFCNCGLPKGWKPAKTKAELEQIYHDCIGAKDASL